MLPSKSDSCGAGRARELGLHSQLPGNYVATTGTRRAPACAPSLPNQPSAQERDASKHVRRTRCKTRRFPSNFSQVAAPTSSLVKTARRAHCNRTQALLSSYALKKREARGKAHRAGVQMGGSTVPYHRGGGNRNQVLLLKRPVPRGSGVPQLPCTRTLK
jgi:hypothetical protein